MPKKKTSSRRAHGEGSIYYRNDRKKWYGMFNMIDPDTGARIRKPVSGTTKEEVSLLLSEMRVDIKRGLQTCVKSDDSVSGCLDKHFNLYIKPFVKANTAAKISGNINRIKVSQLGTMKVSDLSQENVQNWVNIMATSYSEATLRTTISTLKVAIEKMVEQKKLHINPAAGIRIPLAARKAEEARAMDDDIRKRFLEAAKTTKYEVPIQFMLHTGLRSGEMCALNIEDYKAKICISRTWSSAANAIQDDPKTASSIREIPRPNALDDIMTQHLFKLKNKDGTDPLFQTLRRPNGRLKPTHFDDIIAQIADKIGESWITPHTLRHTFASTLFRQGVKINVVSKLLGHKDVQTTYNLYIHMIPQEMEDAIAAVGEMYLGNQKATADGHKP